VENLIIFNLRFQYKFMRRYFIFHLFFLSTFSFAEVTFYRCSPFHDFMTEDCKGKGCYDISIGVSSEGESKAIIWHFSEGSLFHRPKLELGTVQNLVSSFKTNGSMMELNMGLGDIQLQSLGLSPEEENISSFELAGEALVTSGSRERRLKIKCLKLNSETFKMWASSMDNGVNRQVAMRELYLAFDLKSHPQNY